MADRLAGDGVVRAPWGAWSTARLDLRIPAGWDAVELPMRNAPPASPDAVDAAFDNPIDAPRLETLAAERRRVAIAIDDITRPTRTAPLLIRLIDRLVAAGRSTDDITVLVATGAHRPATAEDIAAKAGPVAQRVRVLTHDPADVVETGVLLASQPVRVNRHYMAADLRIGIGGVLPHPFAGFSGGGKIVLPGLSDLDGVVRSHKYALMGFAGGLQLDGNRFRNDMERAVRQIGIDWTVNVAMNADCDTAAVTTGDLVQAHRAVVDRARELGATEPPPVPLDALVLNAYPKDGELLQIEAALVALRAGMLEWLRPGAPVILLAACPDGLGSHQLFGPGGRLFRKPTPKSYLKDHLLHIVSPATAAAGARDAFCDVYPFHQTWEGCAATLDLPASPAVGFAMSGPLHVPAGASPRAAGSRHEPIPAAEASR